MADTTPTTDPRWVPPTALSATDRFFLARLRDERDLIFPRTALRISAFVLPMAVVMFAAPTWVTLALALPYYLFLFTQLTGRYVLMLHATCHRPLFKSEHALLNRWVPWLLGPFFGMTPTSFYVHHMGMHHPENNLESDLSSTMAYTRDRFDHFLHYWMRFNVGNYLHLVRYLWVRNRQKLAITFIAGEIAWLLGVLSLAWIDPAATIVLFVVPLVLMRFFMMCGNWAQHAFVDIEQAANPYRNSTCLTNTRYNHKAYNDGYHIVHHIKPALHWTEMAEFFEKNRAEFGAQDAVVFSGIADNQAVFWSLMLGRYDHLARHLVDLPDQPVRTHDEKVRWLQDRVRRSAHARKGLFEARETPWTVAEA